MAEEAGEARSLAYKYRIYPKPEQEAEMAVTIGCCRYVFNHFLHERRAAYERTCPTLRRRKLAEGADPNSKRPEWARDGEGRPIWDEYENEGYDPEAKAMSFADTSRGLTALRNRPWTRRAASGSTTPTPSRSCTRCAISTRRTRTSSEGSRRARSPGSPATNGRGSAGTPTGRT